MSRRFNGADSRVWFCKSATGDLQHLSAGERRIHRGDLTARTSRNWLFAAFSAGGGEDSPRRFNGADWPPPVLQKRDQKLAAFFGGRRREFPAET